MKKRTLLSSSVGLLTVLALSGLSHAAIVTWNGGDGAYLTGANWSSGSVPNTNTGGDSAVIASGNVEYVAGGDIGIRNGGSLNISGGNWTQTGGVSWIQLGGGSLNISGGTFNQGTAGNIVRNATTSISVTGGVANLNSAWTYNPTSSGSISLTGGTTNIGGNFLYQSAGGENFLGAGGTININNEFKPLTTINLDGGNLSANLISFADGPGVINFSAGNISLNGAGSYSGFYGGGAKGLNFTTGSTGTLFFRTYTLADLTADAFLTNGTLQYNGAAAPSAFSAVEGDGGVYVSLNAVPEPAAPAFLLTGILSILAHRRRLTR